MSTEDPTITETLRDLIQSGREVAPELGRQWFRLQYVETLTEGVGNTIRTLIIAGAITASALGSLHMITDRGFRLPAVLQHQQRLSEQETHRHESANEAERIKRQSHTSITSSSLGTATAGLTTGVLALTTNGVGIARLNGR